jgi:NAD(P)-dependent dehydrogenase (short-subunit alcohol dehydrogenase family)
VVTGGNSGIGAAITARILSDGMQVAVLDVTVRPAAINCLNLQADVTDAVQVREAFTTIRDHFGRIDVLINNAGISGSQEATVCHLTPLAEWERVMAVNVRGPFLCAQAVLPTMIDQGSGHVINIASIAGLVAFPGRSAYTASKGAVVQFTRSLAVDYAVHGIRANAVCPGMVQTPMTQWRLDQPDLKAAVVSQIPLGRVAMPDDIADAVACLASDRMAYVTGHCLIVDGGWTA